MKAINYHIRGIIKTFEGLLKGKYLMYLIPGLVITLLFALFHSKIGSVDEAISLGNGDSWWQKFLSFIDKLAHWFFFGADFLVEQMYIFIVITVLSPFNASLASKFNTDLTGFKSDSGFARFFNDIIRMIFVVIIMLLMELLFTFIFWCLTWILPYDDLYAEYVKLAIKAFFFGLSFYDFALERHGKGVFSTLGYAFKHPLGMIITGLIFLGVYEIPWIGIPLSPVLAVMISTVAYLYYEKHLPKESTELKPAENE